METSTTVNINSSPEKDTIPALSSSLATAIAESLIPALIPKESCCEETCNRDVTNNRSENKQQSETCDRDNNPDTVLNNTSENKQQSETNPNITIKSISYSKTVEYKDGKRIETRKGVKRVNDDWFNLTSDGKWEPSTKDKAIESSHTLTKAIENVKQEVDSPQLTNTGCHNCERKVDDQSEDLLGWVLLGAILKPMISRSSFLDLI